MEDKQFCFLVFPRGDKTKVTVVDLSYSASYERDYWYNVNKKTYYSAKKAIKAARKKAKKYSLTYIMFESRYNKQLNEEL